MAVEFELLTAGPRVEELLALQQRYLRPSVIDPERGFLTWRCGESALRKIVAETPAAVAVNSGCVVGYIVVSTPQTASEDELFSPLIEHLRSLDAVADTSWLTLCQACVDYAFTGHGVLRALYSFLCDAYRARFAHGIGEISQLNRASLRAHLKLPRFRGHPKTGVSDAEKATTTAVLT